MNDINLFHLKYFADAAQSGGISQAARKNFVTQSAVSRAIASLEQVLGVELVMHERNHFQLTGAGEAVFEKCQSVFDATARLRDVASAHLKVYRGPLRFGCNQAIASRLIAPALARLETKHPDIRPEIRLGNTDQIQEMLRNRETDFGIVADDGLIGRAHRTRRILSDRLVVVKAPGFKRRPFENLVVSRTQKGGLSQKYFREYEKAYGKPPDPKIVVPSWQVVMDLALAGYGAALVPQFLCKEALRTGELEVVATKLPAVFFDLCAIVNMNRDFPRNAGALFDALPSG